MEDRFFVYKTSFPKIKLGKDERLLFKSESIDYKFKIYLNGRMLHSQEGMFTPVELDLTDFQKDENTLSVTIFPAPKADRNDSFGKWAKDHRTLARKSVKPPVSYGWDWHPRLINLGICGETKLVVAKKSRIGDFYVNYSLNEDFSVADITLETEGVNIANLRYRWTLKDAEGKIAAYKEGVFSSDNSKQKDVVLNSPKLWWPNGYGTPYLYKSEISLIAPDGNIIETRESKIGFRSVKLAMNAGAWNEPKEEIKTRSVPPMQLVVNGKKIFMKGSNWLPPEVFPAKVSDETYDILTDYAVELNFNIFRMWGGAPSPAKNSSSFATERELWFGRNSQWPATNIPTTTHI